MSRLTGFGPVRRNPPAQHPPCRLSRHPEAGRTVSEVSENQSADLTLMDAVYSRVHPTPDNAGRVRVR
jgi:hypothetical protein